MKNGESRSPPPNLIPPRHHQSELFQVFSTETQVSPREKKKVNEEFLFSSFAISPWADYQWKKYTRAFLPGALVHVSLKKQIQPKKKICRKVRSHSLARSARRALNWKGKKTCAFLEKRAEWHWGQRDRSWLRYRIGTCDSWNLCTTRVKLVRCCLHQIRNTNKAVIT